ncbi:MAG: hypothetical protein Q8P22_01430 [Chloroflexota bacterium]|nr:hypothetical protein [Chloroflexota bacterium]
MIRKAVALPGLVLILALVPLVSTWGSVQAQDGGIGIYPVIIELKDALRGGEYVRTFTVINQQDSDLTFEFQREGDVGAWVSLVLPNDPATPVDTILAPANSDTTLILRLVIPPDAPNGPHSGKISFQSVLPTEENPESSAVGVSIGVAAKVEVDVTGEQKLTGAVVDIAISDVEVGYPLRIRTKFQNTGNVKAKPQIGLQVKDAQAAVVGEGSYSDTAVDPGATNVINSDWDTSGKDPGDYVAGVAVSLADAQLDARQLNFRILPRGALTRQGVLEELTLDNAPYAGAVAKISAHFRNIGQIETRATFLGEIYYKTTLVKALSGAERLVQVGETASLEIFADVPQAGSYTVSGKVNYEGKETEVRELIFKVPRPGGGDGELPLWLWIVISGGAMLGGAVVVGGSWVLTRRLLRFFRI